MNFPKACILFVVVVLFSSYYSSDEAADYYIDQYKDLAIIEMYRTGIPASITLAQGLHESNYGRSPLAREAKNHFGIKCKNDWFGKTFYHKDDDYDQKGVLQPSCFRSYNTDIDSYVDHSNFLMSRDHYSTLFLLSKFDYKGWAHGLKTSGYATDPGYASKLISKIERYGLNQYDKAVNPLLPEE